MGNDPLEALEALVPGLRRLLKEVTRPSPRTLREAKEVGGEVFHLPAPETPSVAPFRRLNAEEAEEERGSCGRELAACMRQERCAHARVLKLVWADRSTTAVCEECGFQSRILQPTNPEKVLDIRTDLERYLELRGGVHI